MRCPALASSIVKKDAASELIGLITGFGAGFELSLETASVLIFPVERMLGYTFISLILNGVRTTGQQFRSLDWARHKPDFSQITASFQLFHSRAILKSIASA